MTELGQNILVVDSTVNQRAKYVVPAINPTLKYITEFEGIDIAVGFSNIEDIKNYLSLSENQDLEYDYMLVDTDKVEGFEQYNLKSADKNFFVTSFDGYSLKKGLEILCELKEVISLTKILFSEYILKEEDDYLNFLSLGYKIIWNEYKIYFPIENGDLSVIYENQRVAKIKFKKLSVQYKDSMVDVVTGILSNVSEGKVRKAIKNIEKGV